MAGDVQAFACQCSLEFVERGVVVLDAVVEDDEAIRLGCLFLQGLDVGQEVVWSVSGCFAGVEIRYDSAVELGDILKETVCLDVRYEHSIGALLWLVAVNLRGVLIP